MNKKPLNLLGSLLPYHFNTECSHTPCPDCMQASDEVGRGMLAARTEPV